MRIIRVCDCGKYQVFNEGDDALDVCCSDKAHTAFSEYEYGQSEHWRMICLARYVIAKRSSTNAGIFLDKFKRRNGAAITHTLKTFCRIEYEKAGGTIKKR